MCVLTRSRSLFLFAQTCQVQRLESILRFLFATPHCARVHFWDNAPGQRNDTSQLKEGRQEQHRSNGFLAAAGLDITLAVCFSVGLLCCTFESTARGSDCRAATVTLNSRWDGYAAALEAPTCVFV